MKKDVLNTGVYVGRFTEEDLRKGKDREAIDAKKRLMPALRHIHSEDVVKRGRTVALDVWLTIG